MAIFNRKKNGRNIRKKVVIIGILCCIFFPSVCFCVPAEKGKTAFGAEKVLAEEHLNMYSGSYALTDGDTGRVLKGKNETVPMANASTTKILTCIVTLEKCSLDEMVTISANAASQPKVRFGMREGEQYTLEEMVYGLMLESFNDCAVAIAEHVAGSEEGFAKLLNEKAREIGCSDTYFITPNGLDAEDENNFHHTTAEDLCKIMAYCTWESVKNQEFLKITQTRTYQSFVNRNAFLDQMDILTGKTGFTSKAGYCYVAALEENGKKYCIALLACGWPNNKTYKWKDARTLFEYGLENYQIKDIQIKKKEERIVVEGYVDALKFQNLNRDNVLLVQGEERCYTLLLKENEGIQEKLHWYTDIKLPIEKGQVLGECHIYLGNLLIDTIYLTASAKADIWSLEEILLLILCQFFTFSS